MTSDRESLELRAAEEGVGDGEVGSGIAVFKIDAKDKVDEGGGEAGEEGYAVG